MKVQIARFHQATEEDRVFKIKIVRMTLKREV
jgi:hypothetical protein